jgi:predicted acyltransferase
MISRYLVPLHRRFCLSETSTISSRILFYISMTLSSFLMISPLSYSLNYWSPMSKPLWTPPFTLQTIGISLLSWTLASLYDFPALRIPGLSTLEIMGRQSLEIYFIAEILQEFVMYPGKRRGGGVWEKVVRLMQRSGMPRDWACLVVSSVWAVGFAMVGTGLNRLGWKIKL